MTTQYIFESDGEDGRPPKGQYLFTIWEGATEPELAWRPEPSQRIVWSPPVYGTAT